MNVDQNEIKFTHNDQGILDDKTCPLTGKNQIPGSVTLGVTVTPERIVAYEPAKGVFAIVLDVSRQSSLSRPWMLLHLIDG